jgi:hypothetical protein
MKAQIYWEKNGERAFVAEREITSEMDEKVFIKQTFMAGDWPKGATLLLVHDGDPGFAEFGEIGEPEMDEADEEAFRAEASAKIAEGSDEVPN